MFMIDMQGTRDVATASRSSRTPFDPYCGSCIASPIRSKYFGLAHRVQLPSPRPAARGHPFRSARWGRGSAFAHETFDIDQIRFGRQANQRYIVPAKHHLRCQQRSIRRPKNKNVISGHGYFTFSVDWSYTPVHTARRRHDGMRRAVIRFTLTSRRASPAIRSGLSRGNPDRARTDPSAYAWRGNMVSGRTMSAFLHSSAIASAVTRSIQATLEAERLRAAGIERDWADTNTTSFWLHAEFVLDQRVGLPGSA